MTDEHFLWESGVGPWAVLAHCNGLTITRWDEETDAINAKDFVDDLGCGHACFRDHELIYDP